MKNIDWNDDQAVIRFFETTGQPTPAPKRKRKLAKLRRRVQELEARLEGVEEVLEDLTVVDYSHLCDCMPVGVHIDHDPGDGWRVSYDDFFNALVNFCPYCGAPLSQEAEPQTDAEWIARPEQAPAQYAPPAPTACAVSQPLPYEITLVFWEGGE